MGKNTLLSLCILILSSLNSVASYINTGTSAFFLLCFSDTALMIYRFPHFQCFCVSFKSVFYKQLMPRCSQLNSRASVFLYRSLTHLYIVIISVYLFLLPFFFCFYALFLSTFFLDKVFSILKFPNTFVDYTFYFYFSSRYLNILNFIFNF